MPLEKLRIVCQFSEFVGFDVVQGVGKRHFSEAVVMAIAFTVGCNVHQLRPITGIGKSAYKTVGKPLAVIEEAFKCHPLRDLPIIKKHAGGFPRRKIHEGTPSWIDPLPADLVPRWRPALAIAFVL